MAKGHGPGLGKHDFPLTEAGCAARHKSKTVVVLLKEYIPSFLLSWGAVAESSIKGNPLVCHS